MCTAAPQALQQRVAVQAAELAHAALEAEQRAPQRAAAAAHAPGALARRAAEQRRRAVQQRVGRRRPAHHRLQAVDAQARARAREGLLVGHRAGVPAAGTIVGTL